MGLLNRTKKPPKMICPACGKPNEPSLIDSGPRRCKICRTILPQAAASSAVGISFGAEEAGPVPAGTPAPPPEHETFDMDGLSMTTFAKAPQGRAALQEPPPEPESFDIGGLEIGEAALPQPSSND
jgi:hypothetical protein